MIKRHKARFDIAEYREKKEIYEACGYKEVKYFEEGIRCRVTFEIDTEEPHYQELRKVAKEVIRKGPPFYPMFIFVAVAFGLFSTFICFFIQSLHHNIEFAVWANFVAFLLPGALCLLGAVLYTYFYFKANEKIVLSEPVTKEDYLKKIEEIKQK